MIKKIMDLPLSAISGDLIWLCVWQVIFDYFQGIIDYLNPYQEMGLACVYVLILGSVDFK